MQAYHWQLIFRKVAKLYGKNWFRVDEESTMSFSAHKGGCNQTGQAKGAEGLVLTHTVSKTLLKLFDLL